MIRQRTVARILFILMSLVFTAVFSPAEAATPRLRVSGWTLPFNLPVMVELERGDYARAFSDFDVRTVDLQSGPKLMAALAAGDLDIVQGIGDAAFLVAASEGVDAKILGVNHRSPKAFAVVTNRPEIRSVADLRGKRVAGLRGSVVHEVFLDALREAGMTVRDVEFFPMPVAQASATLLAGRVDAALLVGSEILHARKSGARVLVDGEGRVRGLSFVVARGAFLEAHPEVAARFEALRERTLRRIEEEPEAAARTAAKATRLDAADIATLAGWYDFSYALDEEDLRSLEATKRYLRENRLLREDVDVASLIYRK